MSCCGTPRLSLPGRVELRAELGRCLGDAARRESFRRRLLRVLLPTEPSRPLVRVLLPTEPSRRLVLLCGVVLRSLVRRADDVRVCAVPRLGERDGLCGPWCRASEPVADADADADADASALLEGCRLRAELSERPERSEREGDGASGDEDRPRGSRALACRSSCSVRLLLRLSSAAVGRLRALDVRRCRVAGACALPLLPRLPLLPLVLLFVLLVACPSLHATPSACRALLIAMRR